MPTSPRLASFFIALALAACSPGGGNPHALKQTPSTSSAAQTFTVTDAPVSAYAGQAKEIFSLRCTPCHGPQGRGDGPASASLNPHPRNFHDLAWQKQASDEHIMKIIQYGGAAVGKSPAMPANPDLSEKPAVVAALKDHIRTLAQ